MNKKHHYTKELLEPLINKHFCWSDVLKELNINTNGGNLRTIKSHAIKFDISTSHFKGRSWAKGLTRQTHDSIDKQAKSISRPDSQIFIENSSASNSATKKAFIRNTNCEYKCQNKNCNVTTWLGKPLTLHLDHINGIRNDNRLENLRLLCPNCHQQTETWGSRNLARMTGIEPA